MVPFNRIIICDCGTKLPAWVLVVGSAIANAAPDEGNMSADRLSMQNRPDDNQK